jgi:hypothetical protein
MQRLGDEDGGDGGRKEQREQDHKKRHGPVQLQQGEGAGRTIQSHVHLEKLDKGQVG